MIGGRTPAEAMEEQQKRASLESPDIPSGFLYPPRILSPRPLTPSVAPSSKVTSPDPEPSDSADDSTEPTAGGCMFLFFFF